MSEQQQQQEKPLYQQQEGYGYQQQPPPQPGYGYQHQPQQGLPIYGYQQPQQQQGQPMAYQAVPMSNEWQSSVVDCFTNTDVCMDTYCCFPCQIARIFSSVDQNKDDTMDPAVCLIICCFGLSICADFYTRMKLVEKYGLREDLFVTGACSCCLTACSTCQQHREILARGGFPGGTLCATKRPFSEMK